MAKRKKTNWTYRMFGDAFTKIGGGIFAGITVTYYFNQYLLDKPVKLGLEYYMLLLLGIALFIVGYYALKESEK